MRVVLQRQLSRQLLRWSRVVLSAVALCLFGYCVFVLANTWFAQRQASRVFAQPREQSAPASDSRITAGELVGRMEIPRLRISVAVAEGTDAATLRRAAGHIAGTALPGQSGNIGIAGHRDTMFRSLRNAKQGDLIMLVTSQGAYRYRVVATKIVSPTDVAVLKPDGHEILTLVTCYPFYFIGPAPDRYIVRAERFI